MNTLLLIVVFSGVFWLGLSGDPILTTVWEGIVAAMAHIHRDANTCIEWITDPVVRWWRRNR